MFTPAEMKKVRIGVLERYSESFLRDLAKVGVLHVKEVDQELKEVLEKIDKSREREKIAELLRRINHLIDSLSIVEENLILPERNPFEELSITKRLSEIEGKLHEFETRILSSLQELKSLEEKVELIHHDLDEMEKLKKLGVPLHLFQNSKFTATIFGKLLTKDLKKIREEIQKIPFAELFSFQLDEKYSLIIIISLRKCFEDVKESLAAVDFLEYKKYDLSEERLEKLKNELTSLNSKISKLKEKLKKDKENIEKPLLLMKKALEKDLLFLDVLESSGKTRKVYFFEGWIPAKKISKFISCVSRSTKDRSFIRIEDPNENEDVPICLDNPKIIKPFELLTKTFGFPRYDELDPTPLLAITFPLFFGFMFGDIGHGLFVFLVGLAMNRFGKTPGMRDLGYIATICGISAMVFGYLYGDVFGLELLEPAFERPLANGTLFLLLAVSIGVIHIGLGFICDIIKCIKRKNIIGAVFGPLSKLWFYYGIVLFFILNITQHGTNFSNYDVFLALPLVAIPLFMLTFSEVILHFEHMKNPKQLLITVGWGLFEVLDNLLIFLSNTASYSRLFALALVHGGLFMAIFHLLGSITHIDPEHITFSSLFSLNGALWIGIAALATLVLLVLEGLIVFIHDLRLHYYEWFTKFYEASGLPYQPFTIKTRW